MLDVQTDLGLYCRNRLFARGCLPCWHMVELCISVTLFYFDIAHRDKIFFLGYEMKGRGKLHVLNYFENHQHIENVVNRVLPFLMV